MSKKAWNKYPDWEEACMNSKWNMAISSEKYFYVRNTMRKCFIVKPRFKDPYLVLNNMTPVPREEYKLTASQVDSAGPWKAY